MRTFAAALATVSALALAPTSASAAELIEEYNPGDPQFQVFGDIFDGPITAAIAVGGIVAGEFTHTFSFTIPQTGLGSGSLITSAPDGFLGSTIDTDFFSILVNGTPVSINTSSGGLVEEGATTNIPITTGDLNTIVLNGLSRGNGSYGGNLTFVPTAPIPEPATWAMMLFGFGALGFVMRRRRGKEQVRVRYAF